MPDGKKIPQFDSEGRKSLWHNLPDKPVAISLVPFEKDHALKVRTVSKTAALPINHPGIEVLDCGDGIVSGIDEQFHTQPTVKCLSCGHTFPFSPQMKAECPACHDHDDWFCADCQAKKEPLVVGNQVLCPDCKLQGKTRGLKRIMKFVISAGGTSYDFQHWIRTGGIEVRWKTDEGRFTVRPYAPPKPVPQQTQ